MPFDPERFWRLANELAQSPADEARLRTAVGRAYYSIFLIARDNMKIPDTTEKVHGEVIWRLRNYRRAYGDQLAKLQRWRTNADYDMVVRRADFRDWPTAWKEAGDLAKRLLLIVKALGRAQGSRP